MATNTRPIKPSADPNLLIERFQSGDAVDPNYGGTGLTNAELAGNVGKVLAVNATADGYTLTTGGGGGGGGGDSLGTGFADGGGSGTVPFLSTASTDDGAGLVASISFFGQTTPISVINLFGFRADNGDNQASMGFTNDDGLGFGTEITDGTNTTKLSYQPGAVVTTIGDGIDVKTMIQSTAGVRLAGVDDAFYYQNDNSAYVMANDRRIPDVGTVNLLKQTPASYDNASAPNNCIFYSTTDGKLSYKDPGGTVNNLY